MRTTINLDEDVLQAAREMAHLHRTTIGAVISELVRKAIHSSGETAKTRNGVPILPARKSARVVTMDTVNRLRDSDNPHT